MLTPQRRCRETPCRSASQLRLRRSAVESVDEDAEVVRSDHVPRHALRFDEDARVVYRAPRQRATLRVPTAARGGVGVLHAHEASVAANLRVSANTSASGKAMAHGTPRDVGRAVWCIGSVLPA